MTSDDPLAVVRAYYAAFQAQSPAEVTDALEMVLGAAFILESPLLEARIGGPATGPAAFAAARGAVPFLKHADIESLYANADGSGVVALIRRRKIGARNA